MAESICEDTELVVAEWIDKGGEVKSTALPSWMYGNPELICDGLIAESRRIEAAEKKHMEIALRQNRRRIKVLTAKAKRGGFKR
jgi:hypothetical protein